MCTPETALRDTSLYSSCSPSPFNSEFCAVRWLRVVARRAGHNFDPSLFLIAPVKAVLLVNITSDHLNRNSRPSWRLSGRSPSPSSSGPLRSEISHRHIETLPNGTTLYACFIHSLARESVRECDDIRLVAVRGWQQSRYTVREM